MNLRNKIAKIKPLINAIFKGTKVEINLPRSNPLAIDFFHYCTKLHPFFKVIKHKTHAVALLNIEKFDTSLDYLNSIRGKNSAGYFARRAENAGYRFTEIDPNQLKDEIFEINTSAPVRHNKKMPESYTDKNMTYPVNEFIKYFGVFKGNKLVAYLYLRDIGDIWHINRLLGHIDFLKDGIMYLLLVKTISSIIENKRLARYVLYDTFLGSTDGLTLYKKRIGFSPYRVKWRLT